MTGSPAIEIDGADPSGEDPPDEIIYQPDAKLSMHLARVRSGWAIKTRTSHHETYERFDTFEEAFAEFCRRVQNHFRDASEVRTDTLGRTITGPEVPR